MESEVANTDHLSFFTTDELAQFLGVSKWSVMGWRKDGLGPRFIRLGKRPIRYTMHDVSRWLAEGGDGGREDGHHKTTKKSAGRRGNARP